MGKITSIRLSTSFVLHALDRTSSRSNSMNPFPTSQHQGAASKLGGFKPYSIEAVNTMHKGAEAGFWLSRSLCIESDRLFEILY